MASQGVSIFYSLLYGKNLEAHVFTWYKQNIQPQTSDIFNVGVKPHLPGLKCRDVAFARYSAEEFRRIDAFARHYDGKFMLLGKYLNIHQTLGARASQAYAEVAVGPVAFFFADLIHDGTNMDPNTVWGGFEFPALTRNPSIETIIQIDANFPLRDQNGRLNPRVYKVIWRKRDGPSPQEPRGENFAYGFEIGSIYYGECEQLKKMLAYEETAFKLGLVSL